MSSSKTPCIGICSTTSVGDRVCRGCKRYSAEVIAWNSYSETEKQAVLRRIEKLNCQILENKLRIFSLENLRTGMQQLRIPYDPALSPYCWLHNLLKKGHDRIANLEEYGVYVLSDYREFPLTELCRQIEIELLELSQAHHDRYLGDRSQQVN